MQNLHEISALQKIRVDTTTILRQLEVDDAAAMLAILDEDPSIRESVTAAARMKDEVTFQEEVAFINDSHDLLRYVIIHGGKIVGLLSFWRDGGYFATKPLPNTYGFGYFLAPSARGNGIVTKSLRKMMNVAVKSLEVTNFIAYCEDGNSSSAAVLQRNGFEATNSTYIEPKHGWVERRYILVIAKQM